MSLAADTAHEPVDSTRWARDPYPDYIAEIESSIAFAGVRQQPMTELKALRLLDLLARKGEGAERTRLLDIGCGVGLIHPHIAPALAGLTGVEVAPQALERARAANPAVDYRLHDGRRLPSEDAAFDAAMAICVMHHVPPADWPGFLAEARRALRPGGWLFVFEHNPWNPLTRLAVARCAFDHDAVLLGPPRTRRLLGQAGFEAVGAEFLGFIPSAKAPIAAFDKALRWCPAGAQYVAFGRRPD